MSMRVADEQHSLIDITARNRNKLIAYGGRADQRAFSTQSQDFSTQSAEVDWKHSDFSADIMQDGTAVVVSFPQGESTFHAPWLWCNDPSFIHPSSGQRLHSPSSFFGWRIASAQVVSGDYASDPQHIHTDATRPTPPPPPGCLHPVESVYKIPNRDDTPNGTMLCVTWVKDDETFASFYDMNWLWSCGYSEDALKRRRDETEIRQEHALRRDSALFKIDYDQIQSEGNNDSARYELLQAVLRDGAALVQNTPSDAIDPASSVAFLGRALAGGSLSHGQLYGDTFHVQSQSNANNLAYTSVPLPPHQDLAYYQSAPGLQLLHCVNNLGVRGGESTLVDALAAANEFRRLAPDLFQTLVKFEATFIKQREGADMVYYRPHICHDSFGSITSVHWSPPFEGPLALASQDVEDYYLAYAAFECMLDNSLPPRTHLPIPDALRNALSDYANGYTWEQRLNPGEVLVFNNQRMVHGRRGFEMVDGAEGPADRHLAGCYTNMEDTLNQYRLLRRERLCDGHVLPVRSAGNGSSGSI
jgi:alpha-ketoglutarate-dependent taurine dioxygenase